MITLGFFLGLSIAAYAIKLLHPPPDVEAVKKIIAKLEEHEKKHEGAALKEGAVILKALSIQDLNLPSHKLGASTHLLPGLKKSTMSLEKGNNCKGLGRRNVGQPVASAVENCQEEKKPSLPASSVFMQRGLSKSPSAGFHPILPKPPSTGLHPSLSKSSSAGFHLQENLDNMLLAQKIFANSVDFSDLMNEGELDVGTLGIFDLIRNPGRLGMYLCGTTLCGLSVLGMVFIALMIALLGSSCNPQPLNWHED